MSEVISVRPEREDLDFVRKISREMRIPKSTYVKQLLHEAILSEKKETALQEYESGKLTLRESAEVAGITPREMMDYIINKKVRIFGRVRTGIEEQVKVLKK